MSGHLILVRPHVSLLDGPVVARYLQMVGGHRGYLFAVDPDYARHRVFRPLLALYGCLTGGRHMVPLDTRSPMAMRVILRTLAAGGGVVLFPQGTGVVDPDRPDRPGADWLVRKSRCSVTELRLFHRRFRLPSVRLDNAVSRERWVHLRKIG
ncbi:1-acyl-sn-glycerol-3-phosphate acyltransferase [Acidithiobacillus acidisediminis]|uniref:1-acyl-sn-glycerol-3-phosphate acyltransferase n=1 Tax=Acidithiobacillus acidisediminis TaxID=2937799 RepID=UPI00200D95C5|nr:1-acyl-sn-glycerol-3-phosphate acyltransferase [Acidithiobacillus sp. S30A2]